MERLIQEDKIDIIPSMCKHSKDLYNSLLMKTKQMEKESLQEKNKVQ